MSQLAFVIRDNIPDHIPRFSEAVEWIKNPDVDACVWPNDGLMVGWNRGVENALLATSGKVGTIDPRKRAKRRRGDQDRSQCQLDLQHVPLRLPRELPVNVCRCVVFAGILIFFSNAAFAQEILLSFEAAEGPGAVPPPRDADGFIPAAPATPVTPSPVIAPPANTIPPPQYPEIWMPAAPPSFVYVPDMPVYAPSCPWWRPCGPGHTWGGNKLFYQGAYGADFRFACANHDACLMNPCNSRYACDRQFLDQMCAACMMSDNPAACMHKAHKYYVLVRVFGVFYRW